MENNQELYHWGIKNMKWGRRRWQNKDGSLTPEGRKRYAKDGKDDPNETTEQKRERLLKSTNAQELYKNRNLLTTQEINDRLNRINTEQRLADLAAKDQKAGKSKVDKILEVGGKIEQVYNFCQKPMMKALMKQLGLSKADEALRPTMDQILKNPSKYKSSVIKEVFGVETNVRKMAEWQKSDKAAKEKLAKELADKLNKTDDDKPSDSQNGNSSSTPKNNTQSNYTKSQPFFKPNPKSEQEKVNEARNNRVDNSDDTPISKGILYDRTGNELLNQFTDTKAADIPPAKVDTGKKYTDDYLKNLRSSYGAAHADSSEGELYHWGIKGMKWGVRRFQNKDGTLTPEGKRHLAENRIRTADNLTEKTIPKGTKMYRTTPDQKDTHGSKSAYVTYLDADRNLYKEGSLVKMYVNRQDQSDVYEHEFELSKDIRIPSLNTVREIETKLMVSEDTRKEVGRAWLESMMLADGDSVSAKNLTEMSPYIDKLDKASKEEQTKIYKELNDRFGPQQGDNYFYTARAIADAKNWIDTADHLVVEQSLGRAKNTKQAIIKELQNRGYNAMYDNAGIGVGDKGGYNKLQEGVEPLIIFDAKSTLKETNTRRVDAYEQHESGERYKQWKSERDKLLRKFK